MLLFSPLISPFVWLFLKHPAVCVVGPFLSCSPVSSLIKDHPKMCKEKSCSWIGSDQIDLLCSLFRLMQYLSKTGNRGVENNSIHIWSAGKAKKSHICIIFAHPVFDTHSFKGKISKMLMDVLAIWWKSLSLKEMIKEIRMKYICGDG